MAYAAVETTLAGCNPEGFAKGCTALAGADPASLARAREDSVRLATTVRVVTGEEDSSPAMEEDAEGRVERVVLRRVGQWPVFEDLEQMMLATSWSMSSELAS